ncbi:hypothetical protein AYJ08_05900 [Brevibacillus sp. SKDU10]|uniref:hypothetical protein n=1 Tax=Brevibacillus sp. SKDU10 TaxID=1247872 RepID=UPI0007C8B2D8|nr:hypothetical protein [Brevibacillus sp. SKDU10]OAJ75147.1 hypothetical protein AYJ08_05900 [Brevibacillus sp. SKDU10]
MLAKKFSLALLSAFSIFTLATGVSAEKSVEPTQSIQSDCETHYMLLKKSDHNYVIPSEVIVYGNVKLYLQSYRDSELHEGYWSATYSTCLNGK